MALRRNSGLQQTPSYDLEKEPGMLTIKLHHGGTLLRSPKVGYVGGMVDYYDNVNGTGKYIEIFVQHDDLDNMLRAGVANGEIRQDNLGDDDEDEYNVGLARSSLGSGVEEHGSFNHVEFFSNSVHEQLKVTKGDNDCIGEDDEGFYSGKESSKEDESTLNIYPKYNPKVDGSDPNLKIGMLFSCREELKIAIDTHNIKDARDVKYIKMRRQGLELFVKTMSVSGLSMLRS
ncbi:hypothetical protein LIER_37358 [Lithospermum erythrorhizon]|uniref:Uncharacterized protein n=1 Tax=Lithospermum erythrorhizon TaxID=34254 RepID=A0AAV3PLB1_LITER